MPGATREKLIGGTTTAVVLVSPAAWEIVLGMMMVILAKVIPSLE